MSELLEPFYRMLEGVIPPAVVRSVEVGASVAPIWDELGASGFLDALVADEHGGAGLELADVAPLWQALGRRLAPVPVAETMVARRLLAAAGQETPRGPIAFATPAANGVALVPFGRVATHVLIDRGTSLECSQIGGQPCEPTGVRGDLIARIDLAEANGFVLPRPDGGLRTIGAVIRAAAIAGAAAHVLEMSIGYANERVQFGKPIGRRQALQQQLAVMAEYTVSVRIAVELACASGLPLRVAAAATAKSVASSTAAHIANTAHAIHGAVGISEEHDLQLYTRRLHEWRLADGSEGYWDRILGELRHRDNSNVIDWVRSQIFAEVGA